VWITTWIRTSDCPSRTSSMCNLPDGRVQTICTNLAGSVLTWPLCNSANTPPTTPKPQSGGVSRLRLPPYPASSLSGGLRSLPTPPRNAAR
jgi:hypothetical protein